MVRCWVFFEPVNFDETVYDNDNLSAIRGASYALLMAPGAFAAKLQPVRQVAFSSSLLCEVHGAKDDIEKVFFEFCVNPGTGDKKLDATLKSMCFSYGVIDCSGDDRSFAAEYVAVRNASQRNRFRLNGARQPSEIRKLLGKVGNRGKYYQELGVRWTKDAPQFPQAFENILEVKPNWLPEKFRYKMAVLEFDADRLGGKLPLDSFDIFSAASRKQQALMQALLQELFDLLSTEGRLELETLLYAGDEGLLVFPAWRLQDVLGVVARHLAGDEVLCSYSVGLVICGVKAPILGIRDLTRKLLGNCKKVHENCDGPDHYEGTPFLQYLVTGGMDVPGGTIENYRYGILGVSPADQHFVFSLKLAQVNVALDLIRDRKTRRDGEAAISRSKIKEAISVVKAYGDGDGDGRLTKFWGNWRDVERWADTESLQPDDRDYTSKALVHALEVAGHLIGTEDEISPLVPTRPSGSSAYSAYLVPLLHAEALMAFLPDTTVGNELEPGEAGGSDD